MVEMPENGVIPLSGIFYFPVRRTSGHKVGHALIEWGKHEGGWRI